ncbi:MAG: DUF4070 domain-containing protein [Fibrobacterota bacterium]
MKPTLLLLWPAFDRTGGCDFNPIQHIFGSRNHILPYPLLVAAAAWEEQFDITLTDENIRPVTQQELMATDRLIVYAGPFQEESSRNLAARASSLNRQVCLWGPSAPGLMGAPFSGLPPINPEKNPKYGLVDFSLYGIPALQFSEGINGFFDFTRPAIDGRHHPRRPIPPVLADLETLYRGTRGGTTVYVPDDNIFGDAGDSASRSELPLLFNAVAKWQKEHEHPFEFFIRCPALLAEQEDLHSIMIRAGISILFLEIPVDNSKTWASVTLRRIVKLRDAGFGVFAAFKADGIDNDAVDVPSLITLMQTVAVPMGCLLETATVTNDFPSPRQAGFTKAVYQPGPYFERCLKWVESWNSEGSQTSEKGSVPANLRLSRIIRNMLIQGLKSNYKILYWKYLFISIKRFRKNTTKLALALYLSYFYNVLYPLGDLKENP